MHAGGLDHRKITEGMPVARLAFAADRGMLPVKTDDRPLEVGSVRAGDPGPVPGG